MRSIVLLQSKHLVLFVWTALVAKRIHYLNLVSIVFWGETNLYPELKALQGSLTTEELTTEIKKLKEECSGYRARLQKIQSATNHIPPEEKEKVGR